MTFTDICLSSTCLCNTQAAIINPKLMEWQGTQREITGKSDSFSCSQI